MAVDAFKSQLEDNRSTIHFFEQKNMEVQNETAVCEENADELNNIDPVYIQMHFPDELATRFFLGSLIDLCMSQVWVSYRLIDSHDYRSTFMLY